ncbi:putative glyoxalase family protein [Aspergillus tanneri]|uniref:VOC domain-containing protein n=1 Tax=Aspergillus tanneri TaxID=1220188 RepID=A0A5M9MHJ7_9EURO|nr:uncharacterized protein ATNIH1004_007898 [Aspergillus tanneri]KAA8646465.1 hypothetical protein ATNIH1004_007898 [Aspergillus tanneri]
MITGISHINLLVPEGTLDQARRFYCDTLGLTSVPVPSLQKHTTAWFNINESQQVHIAFGTNDPDSPRHPCFRVGSPDELNRLKQRIWDHHVQGGDAAPLAADKPGEAISGILSLRLSMLDDLY